MPLAFIPPTLAPSKILLEAASLLQDCRHILEYRITTPIPPPWMSPSMTSYLLSLSDKDLHVCETNGFQWYLNSANSDAPHAFQSLASRATALSANFPVLPISQVKYTSSGSLGRSTRRSKARPRATKRAQIHHLTALTSYLLSQATTPITRIVDVGAGHAHLASHLASTLPEAPPVVAVDRDETLMRSAATLHAPLLLGPSPPLALACTDIGNTALVTRAADLVLGLHPCGALGDAIVESAASVGPAAVVVVSCCLQKIRPGDEARRPLSAAIRSNTQLGQVMTLPRGILGATNRTRGYRNARELTARETRYALRQLLDAHGRSIQRVGDELHGISRHRLRKGLREVAGDVLKLHGVANEVEDGEFVKQEEEARNSYRLMRALTLPRALAGEVMEMAIVLDRAAALEECGKFGHVRTCRVWDDGVSVRNLGCVAWR